MKIPFLLPAAAVCLLLFVIPARAQPAIVQPPASTRNVLRFVPPPVVANSPGTPAPADENKLTRFDLDFPGGTPAELAAAISKAMGKHLNLIIPTEQADARIMPIKVDGVTVPYLFAAIRRASAHTIMVGSRNGTEYRDVLINFTSDSPVSDDTVWSFSSTAPTVEETARLAENEALPQVCRYFQLASYLDNYSIEDITTAIQTGWKMAKVEPMPQLSFHKETSLLIAVGPEANVNQIPAVLGQLQRDRGPAVEKLVKLQKELDGDVTNNAGKNAEEIRHKIFEIAERQKANEEIDDPYRINSIQPPRPVPSR